MEDVIRVAVRSLSLEVVAGAARTALRGDDNSRGACSNVSVEVVAGAARTASIEVDTVLL